MKKVKTSLLWSLIWSASVLVATLLSYLCDPQGTNLSIGLVLTVTVGILAGFSFYEGAEWMEKEEKEICESC